MSLKIKLSEATGLRLKEFRTQYKVKAKDVAEMLGKSPAYISKLEKGQIQQIDKIEFEKILNFIANDDDGYYRFFEEFAERANIKDLENDLAFRNFDMLERKIPVNNNLINFIKEMMKELGISIHQLTNYINENEDLGADISEKYDLNADEVTKNVWHAVTDANSMQNVFSYIFLEYSEDKVEKLLSGKKKKSEYMLVYAIMYHLLKMKYKKEGKEYNDTLIEECSIEAEQILLNYKFYSLTVKHRLLAQSETIDEYNNLLNESDINNAKYVMDIIEVIKFLSEYDVEYTNKKLKIIAENLKNNDTTFAFAYMALSLRGLNDLQTGLKKKFLEEIKALIDKYSNLTETVDNMEKY